MTKTIASGVVVQPGPIGLFALEEREQKREALAERLRQAFAWFWTAPPETRIKRLPNFKKLCDEYETAGGSLDPPPWVPFRLRWQGKVYSFTPEVWRIYREFPGSRPEPDEEKES